MTNQLITHRLLIKYQLMLLHNLDKARILIGQLVLPIVSHSLMKTNVQSNFLRLWKEENGLSSASVRGNFQVTFSSSPNWGEPLYTAQNRKI